MIGWVVLENIHWSETQQEEEKACDITVDKIDYDLQKMKKMNTEIFPLGKNMLKFGALKRVERIDSAFDSHELAMNKKISISKNLEEINTNRFIRDE